MSLRRLILVCSRWLGELEGDDRNKQTKKGTKAKVCIVAKTINFMLETIDLSYQSI